MSGDNLTLSDVKGSINSGHFMKIAGDYKSQRVQALKEWSIEHKAQIGLAMLITGVAIAYLCFSASLFAFMMSIATLNPILSVAGIGLGIIGNFAVGLAVEGDRLRNEAVKDWLQSKESLV